MQFSLMFFSGDATSAGRYDFLLDCAKFADDAGFTAVWLPERHFHPFGGAFPNPAVVGAAVATRTTRVRIRAGSVILPLHDPVRVAEEWSVVDNLSRGRVDLSFGQGWNPYDFVLAPQHFAERLPVMYEGIDTVGALWDGKRISRRNGLGDEVDIEIYPKPVAARQPWWLTCSGGADRFTEAGDLGLNVLTALLFQDVEAVAGNIRAYRDARNGNSHGPGAAGHVTLMLHTFVAGSADEARRLVREPLRGYLETSIDLWRRNSTELDDLSPDDRRLAAEFAFERYFRHNTLCGSVEDCSAVVTGLENAGVDEVACLIDFGVGDADVLASLELLKTLSDRHA
ncbi:MupA/Atu3671 family FMN-dependent luciferase-like monooxygenase [Streptomyces sp. NPDC056373]|uniref:MupA/Atu3671 family FMN-dependent luciferase-like monooxygenase n=1 Tax=Streptomyces sp. NPDC056373 TaxID=3345798 RepID=UPI0035E21168